MSIIKNNFKVTLFDSFEKAKIDWENIEKNGDCYAFQSFHWLKTWCDTVGVHSNLKICIILVEYSVGEPMMLLPLGIEHRSFVTSLVWLGGAITDYHAPILTRNCSEKLAREDFQTIWSEILQILPAFDTIWFEKMPEFVNDQKNPFLYLSCIPNASSAHFSRLSESFDSFLLAHRSKKSISAEKRKQRRLQEQGDISFKLAHNDQDIGLFLEKMVIQKTRSYKDLGVPVLFEQSGYLDFFRKMSENHINDGFIHLSALTLDNRILATHWGMVYKQRFYHMLPTFEQCELTKYSPGTSLLWRLLEWGVENEIKIYDFTIGDEAYKFHWRDCELKIYDYYNSKTLTGIFYIVPQKLMRILKRKIKHSPFLWKISKWLRSRLSRISA